MATPDMLDRTRIATPPLQELVGPIKAGNQDAFAQFHQATNPFIRRVLSNAFGQKNPDVVEETTQDIFLEIWEKRDRLGEGRSDHEVLGYATHLTRWRLTDVLRSIRARPKISDPLPEEGIGAPSYEFISTQPEPEEIAELNEGKRELYAALKRLPPEQREALWLGAQGYSQSEIAEMTHSPLGTAKTRQRLGLKHLKEFMGVSSKQE